MENFFVWGGSKQEVTPWHMAFSLIIVGLIFIVVFLSFKMYFMNRLLIIAKNADQYARALEGRSLPDLDISTSDGSNLAGSTLRQANIILGAPSLVADRLAQAENLQWVQSSFAGIEPFFASGLRRDYILTGVKDVFGPLMSEYVFGYVLSLERNIFPARNHQKQQLWKSIPYRSLAGLTIGICGLGSIGRHIASTAAHFQMRVLGLSRSATQTPQVALTYEPSRINEFAQQLDYMVVALPHTPATKKMISAEVISHLPDSAVLINVGRGATVDQDALVAALRAGRLRGAVLDVFETEPLPAESPFWQLENAYITPHNSALSFPKDVADVFCSNYQRFCSKEPLQDVVDFKRGY